MLADELPNTRMACLESKQLDFSAQHDADWLYPPNVDPSDEETLVKLAVALRCQCCVFVLVKQVN